MGYKDILVFLDDEEINAHRVEKAITLAKLHQARLTGVTLVRLVPQYLKITETRAIARYALQAAEQRVSEFTSLSEAAGIPSATVMFKGNEARAAKRLARFSRNFDLLMLGQANPKSRNASVYEEVAEKVILFSGRPAIFTPYIGVRRPTDRKAIIAWDGSPSAVRSVHDAIPLLRNIEEVTVFVVREGKDKSSRERTLAEDLAGHLRRHGINADVKLTTAGTFSVPTVILNEIADNNFDLLVMGGYGTPSLKQKIFGGVTRTILSSMIIPVLMSH